MGTTYGIRYYNGRFHLHLCWLDAEPPHHWRSSRHMLRKSYRSLPEALNALKGVTDVAIMIFPV